MYLVLIPFITSFVAMLMKFYDDMGKLSIMFWVLFSISCLQIVLMVGIAVVFMDAWISTVLVIVLLLVIWCAINFWVYKTNKQRLPKKW